MRQAGIDDKRLHRIIDSIQQDVDSGFYDGAQIAVGRYYQPGEILGLCLRPGAGMPCRTARGLLQAGRPCGDGINSAGGRSDPLLNRFDGLVGGNIPAEDVIHRRFFVTRGGMLIVLKAYPVKQ